MTSTEEIVTIFKVLLVEDNYSDAILVRRELLTRRQYRFDVFIVESLAAAIAHIQTTACDVVLLDLGLPDSMGPDTAVEFKKHAPSTPVVVLTGLDDRDLCGPIFEAGIQDYLVKDNVSGDALERAIRFAMDRQKLLEQIKSEHSKLDEANRELAARNLQIKHFQSVVSHEMRNALCGIYEFSSLLVDQVAGPVNREQGKYLGHVMNSAEELEAHINDLMDSARIENGKFDLELGICDPGALLKEIAARWASKARKKNIHFECHIADDLPSLVADFRRITQVFSNLLSNAIKFSPAGSRVEFHGRLNEDDSKLEVSVRDQGPGIGPDQLPKITQPLYQIDQGEARREKGLGLGLFICQEIIDLHAGQLRIESELGRGSTFTVTLPIGPR